VFRRFRYCLVMIAPVCPPFKHSYVRTETGSVCSTCGKTLVCNGQGLFINRLPPSLTQVRAKQKDPFSKTFGRTLKVVIPWGRDKHDYQHTLKHMLS